MHDNKDTKALVEAGQLHVLEDDLATLEPMESRMQFRQRDSKTFYAPARDILGFYISLQKGVIGILEERYPDKPEDVHKLQMQANGFINEATAGARKLEIHEFVSMHDLVMKDIDPLIVAEYTRLMCASFMFRYVMGKREQPENQLQPEEIRRSFEGMYIMSVLPEDLMVKVRQHLRAFKHLPDVLFENRPPCEIEEATDDAIDSED